MDILKARSEVRSSRALIPIIFTEHLQTGAEAPSYDQQPPHIYMEKYLRTTNGTNALREGLITIEALQRLNNCYSWLLGLLVSNNGYCALRKRHLTLNAEFFAWLDEFKTCSREWLQAVLSDDGLKALEFYQGDGCRAFLVYERLLPMVAPQDVVKSMVPSAGEEAYSLKELQECPNTQQAFYTIRGWKILTDEILCYRPSCEPLSNLYIRAKTTYELNGLLDIPRQSRQTVSLQTLLLEASAHNFKGDHPAGLLNLLSEAASHNFLLALGEGLITTGVLAEIWRLGNNARYILNMILSDSFMTALRQPYGEPDLIEHFLEICKEWPNGVTRILSNDYTFISNEVLATDVTTTSSVFYGKQTFPNASSKNIEPYQP